MLNAKISQLESKLQQLQNVILNQENELKRFRAAAEQSTEMMIFADIDGIVLWGNQAIEKTTGYTVKETIGTKAGALWGKLMSKEWYAKLWHTIKVDKKIFNDEIVNHRKNGEQFWSTITIYPLLDDQNNINFFVATQRDITRERELDRIKTDFIVLASHQLRTPLTSMKWLLELMIQGNLGVLTGDQQNSIVKVNIFNERMIQLVNGLLNITRIESGRLTIAPEQTDLVELSKVVKSEFDDELKKKKQTLIIKNAKTLPKIMLDQKMFKQVLTNLISNSVKYTKDLGNIELTYDIVGNDVVAKLSDNGYGVPLSEQNRLFERFFRASNATKIDASGTGLGLYLAKIIIEAIGGKISIKSLEGVGTEVWFTVPLRGVLPREGDVSFSE